MAVSPSGEARAKETDCTENDNKNLRKKRRNQASFYDWSDAVYK